MKFTLDQSEIFLSLNFKSDEKVNIGQHTSKKTIEATIFRTRIYSTITTFISISFKKGASEAQVEVGK